MTAATEPSRAEVRDRLLADVPVLQEMQRHRPAEVDRIISAVRGCAEFNARHVVPVALEWDRRIAGRADDFPWDLVRAGLRYRLLSQSIPTVVGGVGGLALHMGLVLEELCSACAGVGNIFGAHALGVAPLLVCGSIWHWETVLREVVESEAQGEPVLLAAAVTEPSAGTDVEEPHFLRSARLSMSAERVRGGYRLNGRKCFISNGSVARYVLVCCATDRRRPLESWTSFLVDREASPFAIGRVEHKMGQRACPAAELIFEDCLVPEESVLGFEGQGMQPGTLLLLAVSRAPVAAIATGIGRGAYEWFLRWARRKQAGHRPVDEQRIQMALAEMRTRIQVSRWTYTNAALAFDNSLGALMRGPAIGLLGWIPRAVRRSAASRRVLLSAPGKRAVAALIASTTTSEAMTRALAHASLAKAFAADASMWICTKALELMATSRGPERLWIEKCFRDVKLTQIYEGTNQLNRLTLYSAGIDRSLTIDLPKLRRAAASQQPAPR